MQAGMEEAEQHQSQMMTEEVNRQHAMTQMIGMEIENDLNRYKSSEYRDPTRRTTRDTANEAVGKEFEARGYKATFEMDMQDVDESIMGLNAAAQAGNAETWDSTVKMLGQRNPHLAGAMKGIDITTDDGKKQAMEVITGMSRSRETMQNLLKEKFGHDVSMAYLNDQMATLLANPQLDDMPPALKRDMLENWGLAMLRWKQSQGQTGASGARKDKDWDKYAADVKTNIKESVYDSMGLDPKDRRIPIRGLDQAMVQVGREIAALRESGTTVTSSDMATAVMTTHVFWDENVGLVPLERDNQGLVAGINAFQLKERAELAGGGRDGWKMALQWYSDQVEEHTGRPWGPYARTFKGDYDIGKREPSPPGLWSKAVDLAGGLAPQ
jgi:hypothetical protein